MIEFASNSFAQRASDRLLARGHLGGQHRAPQGVTTAGELAAAVDRLFDIDSAPAAEPAHVAGEGGGGGGNLNLRRACRHAVVGKSLVLVCTRFK